MIDHIPLSENTKSLFKSLLDDIKKSILLIKQYAYENKDCENELKKFFNIHSSNQFQALKTHALSLPEKDYALIAIFQWLDEISISDKSNIDVLKNFFLLISDKVYDIDFLYNPKLLPCHHTFDQKTISQLEKKQCPTDRTPFDINSLQAHSPIALITTKLSSLLETLKAALFSQENIEVFLTCLQLDLDLHQLNITSIAEKYHLIYLLIKHNHTHVLQQIADQILDLDQDSNIAAFAMTREKALLATREANNEELGLFVCKKIVRFLPQDYTNFFLWALNNRFDKFLSTIIPENYRVPLSHYLQAIQIVVNNNFSYQLKNLLSLYNYPEYIAVIFKNFSYILSSITNKHPENISHLHDWLKIHGDLSRPHLITTLEKFLQLARSITDIHYREKNIKAIFNSLIDKKENIIITSPTLLIKLAKYITDLDYLTQQVFFLKTSHKDKAQYFYKNLINIFTLRIAELMLTKKITPKQQTREYALLSSYKKTCGFWSPNLIEILEKSSTGKEPDKSLQEFINEEESFIQNFH